MKLIEIPFAIVLWFSVGYFSGLLLNMVEGNKIHNDIKRFTFGGLITFVIAFMEYVIKELEEINNGNRNKRH